MGNDRDRASALRAVLDLGPDIDGALDRLCDRPSPANSPFIAVLTQRHVRAALDGFRAGTISESVLERWAEVLHTCEDVDIASADQAFIVDALVELTTPELFGPMSDIVSRLVVRSDEVVR
jgi:hypothetical protein